MTKGNRLRGSGIAALVLAAVILAGVVASGSQLRPAHAQSPADARMPAPPLASDESGTPPPALRVRAIVARAWDDSIATWRRLIGARADEVGAVNLRFVPRLSPMNCYGLYAGEGPAYCSGNRTIFVGTNEVGRLLAQLGPQGEAGITFLIGHEMGHHIQNMFGRFHHLARAVVGAPDQRIELVRRFELQADCYAGVWISGSGLWNREPSLRADLISVLASIGDDAILARSQAVGARAAAAGVHGTSAQRMRWFERGAESGDIAACDTFAAASP